MEDTLYQKIISLKNLTLAYNRARKGKSKKTYVIKFEENLAYNLKLLHEELKNHTYQPLSLKTFILRDPKTRKISKSAFRDRIVHHALFIIIEPLFDKSFIYDCCANRIRKGTLFAIQRFDLFKRKITNNLQTEAFCLKADIKHYFQEVDRNILLNIIRKKINCEKTLNLIKLILNNFEGKKGMPLGNLTSQFFANVYLSELDYFVKHKLRAKYYIRYVDDFVILHQSKYQLEMWREEINPFLQNTLSIELHPDKSKVISLSKGIDFVGFRLFYYHKLLRKRNINKIKVNVNNLDMEIIDNKKFLEIFNGWNAYSKWSNNYNLSKKLILSIKIAQCKTLSTKGF
jgi:hypothetical protein